MKRIICIFLVTTFLFNQDYSLSFDGNGDRVEITNNPTQGLTEFSFLGWFKANPGQVGPSNIIQLDNEYYIRYTNSGENFQIDLTPEGSDGAYFSTFENSINTPSFDEWHFVALTWDGNNTYVYIDDDQYFIGNTNGGTISTPGDSTIYIGNWSTNEGFNGSIDNIQLWHRFLSTEEITYFKQNPSDLFDHQAGLIAYYDFNSGAGDILYDVTINSNNGTIYGATWIENINGCTDELACNFNEAANIDDGNCEYEDLCGECGGDNLTCEIIFDIDGNAYGTVTIGDQVWMKQNLKTSNYNNGDQIPTGYSNEEWVNLSHGALSVYNNDSSNKDIYGNLYNWWAANDERGVCPEGWDIPSGSDWDSLIEYLGGSDVAGGKLKHEGFNYWNTPNEGASNESGFSALPAGWRHSNSGLDYEYINELAAFWNSESASEYSAVQYMIWNYSANIQPWGQGKKFGNSVRCIQMNLGCTDELAENYNSDATIDDASCEYPDNGDYSLSFDGIDDYVSVESTNNYNSETFGYNISFFPSADNISSQQTLINQGPLVGGMRVRVDQEGWIYLIKSNLQSCDHSDADVSFGEWNDLRITYDGEYVTYIINGNQTVRGCSLDFDFGGELILGHNHNYEYFNGNIKDFSYWSDSDTNQDPKIEYKFNIGSGDYLIDRSGNQNHGIIHGATWIIPGCMDPLAENYNSDATIDDGSCIGSPVNAADFTYAGELNEHYYYLSNNRENWDNAKNICESNNGHLVSISDEIENDFLGSIVNQNLVWIGLNDIDEEGSWQWVDGTNVEFFNWRSDQPNGSNQNCVDFWPIADVAGENFEGQFNVWTDGECFVDAYFVLEIEAGCTDESACNYHPYSYEDDGSCTYAEENFDCDGNCLVAVDCQGICGGDATNPNLSLSQSELAYNVVVADETNQSQTLTITNDGDCDLDIQLNDSDNENWILSFDGDDYIHINHIDAYSGINSYTWSSWVKLDERDAWSDNMFLWNKDHYPDYSQSSMSLYFDFRQESNQHRVNADLDGSGIYDGYFDYFGSVLKDWKWHLITVTYNVEDDLKLYIDGQLFGSTPAYAPPLCSDIPTTCIVNNDKKLQIGTHAFSDRSFLFGDIYDFLFNNDALTQEEILAIYNLGFDGNNPSSGAYDIGWNGNNDNILGYWKLDENNNFHDFSAYENHAQLNGTTPEILPQTILPDWLSCDFSEVTITSGESFDLECQVDVNGLDSGDYTSELSFSTNDPNNASITVPVTLNVGKPSISAEIPSGEFGELEFNASADIRIPLSNSGNMPLTVNLSELTAPLTLSEPLTLNENEIGEIIISFTCGVDDEEVNQTLTLTTNDPYNESITLSLSGACVPTSSPIILSGSDVPDDQGGYIALEFTRSYFDDDGFRPSEYYTIERFEDFGTGQSDWVGIFSQAAYADERYSVIVPTGLPVDSPNVIAEFRVVAAMDEGAFESNLLEATSIDNLNPNIPDNLSGNHDGQNISLSWLYNEDSDFLNHKVESLCEDDYTIENSFNDEVTSNEQYQIHSGDFSGNRSSSKNIMTKWLHSGNNLISFSVIPDDPCNLENIFSDVCASAIIGEGVAASQLPNGMWVGSLSCIEPSKGYWLSLNCDDVLFVVGDDINADQESLDLHYGLNLIGYPFSYNGDSISESIPSEFEESFQSIIGEGVAASPLPNGMWVGSLSKFKATDGYWVKVDSDIPDFYFNGCDNRDCASSCDIVADGRQNSENIQTKYQFNQSMNQAFYFFKSIELENYEITSEDYIVAFYNEIILGYRQYSGDYTDVPVMGNDGTSLTAHYLDEGLIPEFKILKSDGTLINLYGNFPAWQNNEVFFVDGAEELSINPTEFILDSVYPNPFNPSTNISFAIPFDSKVEVGIYDISGRLVAELVNDIVAAGYHDIKWNASNEASGVYIVKMEADGFFDTQKMMLIK